MRHGVFYLQFNNKASILKAVQVNFHKSAKNDIRVFCCV